VEISVDTSVIIAVILNEPTKPRLLDVTLDAELQSAPSLPWEVGNALSALFKRGSLNLQQARKALDSFVAIPVRLADIDLEGAVEIADAFNIYAYDAYILECARRYRTPLLSLDGPQCEVARKLGIEVLEVDA
jgi:predicted nucleic acid-binding protein